MKTLIQVVLLTFGLGICKADSLTVRIDFHLKSSKTKIRIYYENPSDDTLSLWIQDWRFTLLKGRRDQLKGYPFTSNLANILIVSNKKLDILRHLSSVEYSPGLGRQVKLVCLKKLLPHATFIVEFESDDPQLFDFLKAGQFKTSLTISLTNSRKISEHLTAPDPLYYDGDMLILPSLPVTGNTTSGMRLYTYQFTEPRELPTLRYKELNDVFSLYYIDNVKTLIKEL